jgi:integrase
MTHGWKRQKPRKIQPDDIPHFEMADESQNVRMGFIEEPGYRAISKELPVSLKALFICVYHVSTRKGELKNILWSQVDFDDEIIVLEHGDTKGKVGRYLPIYGDMLTALKRQKTTLNSTTRLTWAAESIDNCLASHLGGAQEAIDKVQRPLTLAKQPHYKIRHM